MTTNDLLTTKEAAKLLRLSPVTLEKWRIQGKGPEYVKVGRLVKYRGAAIETYLRKNTVHN